MLGCKFFCACPVHRDYKKNEVGCPVLPLSHVVMLHCWLDKGCALQAAMAVVTQLSSSF